MPKRTSGPTLSRKSPYERVVNLENGPIASGSTATRDVGVVHTHKNNLTSEMSKLSNPENTNAVPEESLALLSKAQVEFRGQQLLRKCEKSQQDYKIAVQHFDVHYQFFTSACASNGFDRIKDIIATLREVQRAGRELFVPQDNYILAISKYRLFLAELLPQLPIVNLVRANITVGFNNLSRDYEVKENTVRETIGAIFLGEGGSVEEKLRLYFQVFMARGDMLKLHQETLENWVKDALAELPAGYMAFQKDSCIAEVDRED